MSEFTFTDDDHEPEQHRPEPSTVLIQLVPGNSYMFKPYGEESVLDIGELQYEGGSASIEAEQGMLGYACAEMMAPDFWREGWFVIEGFYGHYSRDYYGEVDCDFECTDIRPARWSDMDEFGCGPVPLRAKIARLFGRDLVVNRSG